MKVDSLVASSHTYSMRELNQNTARVLREINESGEPALITRQGRPVALITPLANERTEAAVLGAVLESVSELSGREPLSEVHSAEEVARELDVNHPGGYA
jgi:prevent-host-death family protein